MNDYEERGEIKKMEYRYVPEGVCSTELIFKIEGNIIKN